MRAHLLKVSACLSRGVVHDGPIHVGEQYPARLERSQWMLRGNLEEGESHLVDSLSKRTFCSQELQAGLVY